MPKIIRAIAEFVDKLAGPRDGESIDASDVNPVFEDLLGNDLFTLGRVAELTLKVAALERLTAAFVLTLPVAIDLEPSRTYELTDAVRISRVNGYVGTVSLQALDLPAGVTATFTPNPAPNATGSATLTLDASVDAVPGPYDVTVRGTGDDGKVAEARVRLNVAAETAPSRFAVALPANLYITRSATGPVTHDLPVRVERSGGFDGPIAMSVTNLPAGLQASFTPNPILGSKAQEPGACVLTLTVGPTLPYGRYSLNVRAVSGSRVQTQAVMLEIHGGVTVGNIPDYVLQLVYDGGDQGVVNGATVFVERRSGFIGPVTLTVPPLSTGPIIYVNGQPWTATITGNQARLEADGSSRGFQNSGVAGVPFDWPGGAVVTFARGEAIIGGKTEMRGATLSYRTGNLKLGGNAWQTLLQQLN